MAKALYVDGIRTLLTRSQPPRLLLHVNGRVSSSGWSDAHLDVYVNVAPPADGFMSFDLAATPPAGPSAEVISPICASISLVLPRWCKGVRVHASANTMEQVIPGRETVTPQTEEGDGDGRAVPLRDPDSWPWLLAPVAQPTLKRLEALGAKSMRDGTISELIGRNCWFAREGDGYDAGFFPDRVTIVLARDSNKIVDILFG